MVQDNKITNHIHHVHIFASDLNKSLQFYEGNFGGRVILDAEFAGARNVFMRVGNGRLHFYDHRRSILTEGISTISAFKQTI